MASLFLTHHLAKRRLLPKAHDETVVAGSFTISGTARQNMTSSFFRQLGGYGGMIVYMVLESFAIRTITGGLRLHDTISFFGIRLGMLRRCTDVMNSPPLQLRKERTTRKSRPGVRDDSTGHSVSIDDLFFEELDDETFSCSWNWNSLDPLCQCEVVDGEQNVEIAGRCLQQLA